MNKKVNAVAPEEQVQEQASKKKPVYILDFNELIECLKKVI